MKSPIELDWPPEDIVILMENFKIIELFLLTRISHPYAIAVMMNPDLL